MKLKLFIWLIVLWTAQILPAQSSTVFSIQLDEVSHPGLPGVHSFAWGQDNGKWLILSGRTDGLHQRQPFAAFLASDNNTMAFVIDPATGQYWSQNLNMLSSTLQEQLQSTNTNFYQRGNTLYIIGGYGYSASSLDHITYPNLTAVDVPGAINAIVSSTSLAGNFRQVNYPSFAVTGGQLGYLDSTFYLVGGQNFIGRYNPMGPNHGPGFFQQYTNEIRTFQIDDDGTNLNITNYSAQFDSMALHRRDYNMVPTIYPNSDRGFQLFSGVFQHTVDLPWLNLVNIKPSGFQQIPGFQQLLSHYHSARLPVYDQAANNMHTWFFGGIARFYFDGNNSLVDDTDVPFVKTISRITRFPNDSLVEYDTGKRMPGLLGAGAEFIPLPGAPFIDGEILDVAALPGGLNHVGYIYGGIESTAENIFFINTGTQSSATNRLFKVMVNVTATSVEEPETTSFALQVFPEENGGRLKITFQLLQPDKYSLRLTDVQGRVLKEEDSIATRTGAYSKTWNVGEMSAGMYLMTLYTVGKRETVRFRID